MRYVDYIDRKISFQMHGNNIMIMHINPSIDNNDVLNIVRPLF